MIHQEIITMAREWLDDEVLPYRWSLSYLIGCFNKAVNELCEKARIQVDSTTETICKVDVLAGTAKYPREQRVVEILRGRLVTGDRRVTRRTRSYMDHYCSGWDSSTASSGTPKNFIEDLDTGFFTLHPKPEANDTLWLTVIRYPLVQLTTAILDQLPEIHFKYHFELLDGLCGYAYLKQDPETYDPKKAERHLALWRNTINQRMLEEINRNDIDEDSDPVPDYLE